MNKYHSLENWLAWMDQLAVQDYVVIDNFLKENLYAQIRSFFLSKLNDFNQAGIGAETHSVNTEIRSDYIYWLDKLKDTELQEFWILIHELQQILKEHCFLSLSDNEFHLANYPKGSYYAKHLDQFNRNDNRKISVIIYLNEDWEKGDGGELKIFEQQESFLVEPIACRCVLFKSDKVLHSVLQSQKNRYSLTGWLLHKPSDISQFKY